MTGSQRWPATAWRRLLELILPTLDELGSNARWTLGGGTALALRLHHRISYDIDIFLEDAGHLKALSPNRNKTIRKIADTSHEPGHYIKLEREEGAIDFILAPTLTEPAPWLYKLKEREIPVEEPAEVISKKLKFRGSRFVARDIFDILAVNQFDPAIIKTAIAATPDGARRAADRIRRIQRRYREAIQDEVNPTASGVELLEIDPLIAAEILNK